MTTRDRVRAQYETTLKPRLEGLEGLRRTVRTAIVKSAIIVGIPMLGVWWLQRVRRVDIDGEAIRIYRGLRPLPRTYRRPLFGCVVRLDRCVYVGRTDSASPINPSASPVLRSDDEARWVAAETRRALG